MVAGQTHELALGAKKALQTAEDQAQRKKWLALPVTGIGIASQVKPLVDERALTAAVISSVTTELALRMLVRAIETQIEPPERSIVDASSYPELDKLLVRR